MDYALLMRCIERARHLTHDFHSASERHWTFAPDNLFQGLAMQVLHDQKYDTVFGFAKVSDADGMRMRDARGGFGFARKARHYHIINAERLPQHFDGHGLVHQHVLAAIDRAHTAALDKFFD